MKSAHAKMVPRDVSEEEELDAGAGVGAIVGTGVKDGDGVAPGLGVAGLSVSAGDGVSAEVVPASTLDYKKQIRCTTVNMTRNNHVDRNSNFEVSWKRGGVRTSELLLLHIKQDTK